MVPKADLPCARNALVVVRTVDRQDGDSGSDIHQNERERLRKVELSLLAFSAKMFGKLKSLETPRSQHLLHLQNVTCVFVVIALGAIVQVGEEDALDERVQLVEFGQLHVDLITEILLELEGSAAGRANRGNQLSHALLLGQRQEIAHVGGLEANEMQGATSLTYLDIVHLKGN